jgi:hypothetical protein
VRFEGHPNGAWMLWFAWRPVRLSNTNTWVWLELIERWQYRGAFVEVQYRDRQQ